MPVFNTISTLTSATSITGGGDYSQPYSFIDWKARNNNITSADYTAQYNSYLTNWYINKGLNNAVSVNYVKNSYITFLKTLGITARTPQEEAYFNAVDLTDNISLQSTIAGYARRLKDIAVYLANKRNHIKYTKLKSNLTGTSPSLERLFYSYILTAFTLKTTPDGQIVNSFVINTPNVLDSLPYLSDIANNFDIEIEELYDIDNYFDRDPSLPVTTYATIAPEVPAALYTAGDYSIPEDYLINEVITTIISTSVSTLTGTAVNNTGTTALTYWTYMSDGTTTTYTLSNITSSQASDYQVTIDGIVQTPGVSYTISTQNQTITFCSPPPPNNVILIVKRY